MVSKKQSKLIESVSQLEDALGAYKKETGDTTLYFLAVVKAFEIVVEYSWREFKARVEDEGLDAPSPKQAVKRAAQIGMIDKPDKWISFINARNDSVHDYFGVPPEDYIKLSEEIVRLAKKIR